MAAAARVWSRWRRLLAAEIAAQHRKTEGMDVGPPSAARAALQRPRASRRPPSLATMARVAAVGGTSVPPTM
jgi:hypothetical protein